MDSWLSGCSWCSCWLHGRLRLVPLYLCLSRVYLRKYLEPSRPKHVACRWTMGEW